MRLAFLLIFIFLVGCSQTKIEDKINTFDDLKKAKEAGEPISEFDKCAKEAKRYETEINDCTKAGVVSRGYSDGLDCVAEDYTTPICEDTDRYDADVESYNECIEKPEFKNRILLLDCTALI